MKKPKLDYLHSVVKSLRDTKEELQTRLPDIGDLYPVPYCRLKLLEVIDFDDLEDLINWAKAFEEVRKMFSPLLPAGNNPITIEEGDGVIALSQKNLGLGTIREIINRHGAHPIYMVEFKEGVHVPYNESEIEIQYVHHEPY